MWMRELLAVFIGALLLLTIKAFKPSPTFCRRKLFELKMTAGLFTPLKLGSQLQLANRIVMAPLTRSRAGTSRVPNDYMRQYYEMRASAGLIVSEATAISDQGYGWYGSPGLYTEEHATAWKPVVQAVQNRGGKFFLQLWHMGRRAHSSFHEVKETVGPSAIAIDDSAYIHDANRNHAQHEVPRALRTEEIPLIVEDYKRSALLAKKAGFDGVEIHAANGYLLDSFLQSVTNKRTDAYGCGNLENRFRFLREVTESVGEVFPFERIGVRFSPNAMFSGMGSDDNDQIFPYAAKELNKYGLAYIHLMDGIWRGFHQKCRRVTLHDIKKNFDNGAVIGNVEYTRELAEGVIRSGAADAVAFGRPFLSNPDLVERFQNNWPLNPVPANELLYGWKPDPAECLEGYLNYEPFQTTTPPQ
jgi:N-ethylmaleimide reductase